MIILLDKSALFTRDPAVRFSSRYHVKQKVWHELLRRRWLLDYDYPGLCGYFIYRTGKKITPETMKRWVTLSEIYAKSQHVMSMGVRSVDSSYFGSYEQDVLDELLKSMKYSTTHDSRSLV